MNRLVEEANTLLQGQDFSYAICGGFALDLFLGYESRVHGDIDVLAFWEDREKIITFMQSKGFCVFEMLGGGKVHRITDIRKQEKFTTLCSELFSCVTLLLTVKISRACLRNRLNVTQNTSNATENYRCFPL